MKKIIPFKKEIIFKTNLAEITSISLEHSLKKQGDHLIAGSFSLNGEYKITDTSTNTEVFSYDLPFDIHIDDGFLKTFLINPNPPHWMQSPSGTRQSCLS